MLWSLTEPDEIVPTTADAIRAPVNTVVVSAASAWELGIKQALGRLRLPRDLEHRLAEVGFEPLEITLGHGLAAAALPLLHRDPFDRMLVAQAQIEGLTIVTRDPQIGAYEVPVLRA